MDLKLIGGILLIIGTSIGAGMLALPIATAELGFVGSLVLLLISWGVMTAGALALLEVNLWMPAHSNIVSMARETIGPVGQAIAWITFLLLLYSLLCAYIAGGSDLLHDLLNAGGMPIPVAVSAIVFTLLFGAIVFFGIRQVDYVNRGLMLVKFFAYFLLIILLVPFVDSTKLMTGELKNLSSTVAITVTITSFGYATIIPSLRMYFGSDVRKLKIAIFVGSLIPLVCYILWDMAIMGIIPLHGDNGLVSILNAKASTSDFVDTLSATVSRETVTVCAKLFTSICMLTSFLGVALCLADFLADGLHLQKKGSSNFIIHTVVFLPPLLIVLFFPNVFVKALEYAGIYCVILLVLLPAWMAWQGRYRKQLAHGYRLIGGKPLLMLLMVFSIIMVVRGLTG